LRAFDATPLKAYRITSSARSKMPPSFFSSTLLDASFLTLAFEIDVC